MPWSSKQTIGEESDFYRNSEGKIAKQQPANDKRGAMEFLAQFHIGI